MRPLATKIDGPVAVIGDVHGQVDQLSDLLAKLHAMPDSESRWIVFIGDFVDRGSDPQGALDIVIDLIDQRPRVTAVCGNHDLAMAASLDLVPTPEYTDWAERWIAHYDSETTFQSYDAEIGNLGELRANLPEQHGEFLVVLPWCVEHPQLLFVHAGLDPHAPFEIQLRILREKDFSLNHPQWLCSKDLVDADGPRDCPFIVVSGHVQLPQVEFRRKRILVDTTGGLMGELSCVLWPENRVITSGIDPEPEAQSPKSWWKLW